MRQHQAEAGGDDGVRGRLKQRAPHPLDPPPERPEATRLDAVCGGRPLGSAPQAVYLRDRASAFACGRLLHPRRARRAGRKRLLGDRRRQQRRRVLLADASVRCCACAREGTRSCAAAARGRRRGAACPSEARDRAAGSRAPGRRLIGRARSRGASVACAHLLVCALEPEAGEQPADALCRLCARQPLGLFECRSLVCKSDSWTCCKEASRAVTTLIKQHARQ